MLTINWKKYALSGGLVLATIGSIGGVTALAHQQGVSSAFLDALGITQEQYTGARDEANAAMINQAETDGWITAEEAAELIENGRGLRLGRSPYYKGIYDKAQFLADALDVTVAEIEAAREAAHAEKIEEMIAAGRITAEDAAARQAAHEFKESIDKDALLATALGISTTELDAYRNSATAWVDVLADLGLTQNAFKEAADAAMAELIANAVANGELTEEQAASITSLNGKHHGGYGGGGRGHGGRGHGGRGQW